MKAYPQWPEGIFATRCPYKKVFCERHLKHEQCNNDAKEKFGGFCYAHKTMTLSQKEGDS